MLSLLSSNYYILITNSYCKFSLEQPKGNVNRAYHDTEYGFPLVDDNELFGRLILEINQAGLSWTTILNKKENFRKAYSNFDILEIADYSTLDIERLLNDAGIIRNKLKINAAIFNAKVIIELQNKFGSFLKWLEFNHPLNREEWVKLFKKTFKFTGGEITNEFLMSTGFLQGAHDVNCPIHTEILQAKPQWVL